MKTEYTVVELQTTIASDLKEVELNLGTEVCESHRGLVSILCTSCNKQKSSDDFHKNKAKPNGRQAHCKECTSKNKKKLYKKKLRQAEVENGFHVSICGTPSEIDFASFSTTFAEAVRELVDHEKL